MNSWILTEYKRLRKLDWSAKDALRAAKIKNEFEDLEALGLVKFGVVPDEFVTFDDLAGYIDEKAKKELEKQIDRDGVWEIFTSFRVSKSEEWEHVDGVCGFVGDGWRDSGYDIDVKENAIKGLKTEQEKRWNKEAEELANRATYAG